MLDLENMKILFLQKSGKMIKKTVIINRAVPGSGKTTITNCIKNTLLNHNINIKVFSTDEYFMINDRYVFDIKKLYFYHSLNLDNFKKAIESNIDVVVCDNTNLAPWQTSPYTELAREFGYQIIILSLKPRELEKHIASQIITPQKPDAHQVSKDILIRMIKEYEIYDDLLDKNSKINEEKHLNYKWDNKNNIKIQDGISKHFDSDYVIEIYPDEYIGKQEIIGDEILNLIKN